MTNSIILIHDTTRIPQRHHKDSLKNSIPKIPSIKNKKNPHHPQNVKKRLDRDISAFHAEKLFTEQFMNSTLNPRGFNCANILILLSFFWQGPRTILAGGRVSVEHP